MPDNNPGQNANNNDETRDEHRRAPSSDDRDQRAGYRETKPTRQPDHEDESDTRSSDTDPDSPDADIDRDDMIDEP